MPWLCDDGYRLSLPALSGDTWKATYGDHGGRAPPGTVAELGGPARAMAPPMPWYCRQNFISKCDVDRIFSGNQTFWPPLKWKLACLAPCNLESCLRPWPGRPTVARVGELTVRRVSGTCPLAIGDRLRSCFLVILAEVNMEVRWTEWMANGVDCEESEATYQSDHGALVGKSLPPAHQICLPPANYNSPATPMPAVMHYPWRIANSPAITVPTAGA
jgi:hypothetical protein